MEGGYVLKITKKVLFLKNLRAEYPFFECDGGGDVSLMNLFSEKLIGALRELCEELGPGKTYCLSYELFEKDGAEVFIFSLRLRIRGEGALMKKIKAAWRDGFISSFEVTG